MTAIKTCGMFREIDIEAVNTAKPDYCGFIVNFDPSPRSISTAMLRKLTAKLDENIKSVGVFVDEDINTVSLLANEETIDYIQLHGSETADYITKLKVLTDTPVIKAFKVRRAADINEANDSPADIVLLDNGYGTGKAFDWTLIGEVGRPFLISRPFFIAGGLTPENIPEVINRFHPHGIDISSGIETDGLKDPEKIMRAVAAAHATSN